MEYFNHEKLDVYKVAMKWIILSEKVRTSAIFTYRCNVNKVS